MFSPNNCVRIRRSRLTPLGAICTFLVCERCRGAGSPWYPYVSTLPQSYTVPAYWPDELIHRLPSIIRETALSQKESVLALYKRCRDILDNASHLCTDLHGITITLEQFIWAWSTVNTRCVYWRQNDDPNLEKDGEDHYALVPFLDLLNHAHNVQVCWVIHVYEHTVQITFIFICQTHLVFGKCVCTCIRKHSNTFRTSLNWLRNLKCVWHEPKKSSFAFASFRKFWSVICERLVGLVSFETNVSSSQIHEIELVYRDDLSLDWMIMYDVRGIKCIYKWNECHVYFYNASWSLSENRMHLKRETQGAFCVSNTNAKSQTRKSMKINVICTVCPTNSK